jgi:translation initiation factor IF-2
MREQFGEQPHAGSDPLAAAKAAARRRLYEVAKEVGLPNKEVVAKAQALGIDVKNQMSVLQADDVVRLRRAIDQSRQDSLMVEQLGPAVIRRRTRAPAPPPAPIAVAPPPPPPVPATAEAPASRPGAPPAAAERPAAGALPAAPAAPKVEAPGTAVGPPAPRIEITDLSRRRGEVVRRDLVAERERLRQAQRAKKKRAVPGKKTKQTQITTPAEHKRVIRIEESISVSELARRISVKATEVLKRLWSMGMTGVNINQNIDADTAALLAGDFGYEVESVGFREEEVLAQSTDAAEDMVVRAPVVTVMGHVDHGKTSLLDAIRQTNVAAGEAGGITQHVGAYRVSTPQGDVSFVDTPGHEAFTAMRARGAQVTDIVVLVVAADDGVMPQTVEAVEHARAAGVPIVVAVNKIDKPGVTPDRVRTQLAEKGLVPEAWGGETIYVDVSAKTRAGVPQLLENLAVQAELLELRANPNKPAKGAILEARLDRARGPMASVIIQEGTLKVGDLVVTGEHLGKVRAMYDDRGRQIAQAGPSMPIEILGLGGVPEAGDLLYAVADERAAKTLIEHRRDQRRKKEMQGSARGVSLESIMEKIQEGQILELKIVLKADVQGSAEALRDALMRLGTEQVRVTVIGASVGGINETDVNLAKASGAVIVGFHVRPAGKASALAEQEGVEIKLYDIIYEALDDVRKTMAGLLAPVEREKQLGRAEVLEIFHISKVGTIAGCRVTDGKITRSAQVRLVRDSVKVYEGRIGSLRRFKDDAREVEKGYECGISIDGYQDLKQGDVIEAFEIEQVAATL